MTSRWASLGIPTIFGCYKPFSCATLSHIALSITGGGAGTEFSSTISNADNPLSGVNEGDVISLTPSGATGSANCNFTILLDGRP